MLMPLLALSAGWLWRAGRADLLLPLDLLLERRGDDLGHPLGALVGEMHAIVDITATSPRGFSCAAKPLHGPQTLCAGNSPFSPKINSSALASFAVMLSSR